MNLEELVRAANALDEPAFVRAFPDPALVVLGAGRAETAPFDTRCGARSPLYGTTARGRAFDPNAALGSLAETHDDSRATPPPGALAGTSAVAFVKKGAQNPFAHMITVGRAPNNDVCFPLTTVSKVHAYFERTTKGWKLTDQRSTNGTFVDGVRIAPGASVALPPTAQLGFGPDVHAKFAVASALHGMLVLLRSGVS